MATDQAKSGTQPSYQEQPRVTVLGKMDGQLAIRVAWTSGVFALSAGRLKFLSDIGIDVDNTPENYVL